MAGFRHPDLDAQACRGSDVDLREAGFLELADAQCCSFKPGRCADMDSVLDPHGVGEGHDVGPNGDHRSGSRIAGVKLESIQEAANEFNRPSSRTDEPN